MPLADTTLEALLEPLRRDPERSAVLLDVDGVLAPIVAQPDDAHMPETTRRPLIDVARRYGTVACVSGRRASDARRPETQATVRYRRATSISGRRVVSGMWASSGSDTIGASTPSTSNSTAERSGSFRSGSSRLSSAASVGGIVLVCRPT